MKRRINALFTHPLMGAMIVMACVLVGAAPGWGQVGDFGDAPDNTYDSTIEAYPGVPGRFPSFLATDYGAQPGYTGVYHIIVNEEWLDTSLTSTTTTEADAKVPDLDEDNTDVALTYDAGNPMMGGYIIFPVTALESGYRYVNILLDQDLDGRWTEAHDHIVQDVSIQVEAGFTRHKMMSHFPLFNEDSAHWVRVTLTKAPLGISPWDGSIPPGGLAYGETEDHLLLPTNIYLGKNVPNWRAVTLPQPFPIPTPGPPKCKDFTVTVFLWGDPPGGGWDARVEFGPMWPMLGGGPGPTVWKDKGCKGGACIVDGDGLCASPVPPNFVNILNGGKKVFDFSANFPEPENLKIWGFRPIVIIDPDDISLDGIDVSSDTASLVTGYPTINIGKTHNTYQGQYEDVSITIDNTVLAMGGFNFLIAYDASALAFTEATPGQLLADCEWEYFTYRYGVDGNCGDACPSGLLRIIAIAETNNGPNHPSCYGPPDYGTHELVSMKFLVSNDRTLECMYVPVRFFWTDCGDNTVSSMDGEVLYVSEHVYEFEGTDITDPFYGFPTYFGVQPECLNPDPDKPTAIQFIDFVNGGIDIICVDSIDDRGDINLNGTPNEIADAVLFSNYFVQGISVFNVNIDGQIAASDVNADGITLSVADLVYQIRIIVGDALPYYKVTPVVADADLVNGVLSVNSDMGAAYVVVENSVTPLLLAESMEMKYQYDEDNNLTRILVYSMEKDRRFSGDFLGGIDGNVITLEMATYDGVPVTTKLVPEAFALYPCYPNPFNPITTISFALAAPVDYELVIYNALGQTVKTFTGHSGPGLERVDWDASAYSSGVYFYRLTAGDFNDTKKMVLLK